MVGAAVVECAREEEGSRLEGLACGALRSPQRYKLCLLRLLLWRAVFTTAPTAALSTAPAQPLRFSWAVSKSKSAHTPIYLSISLHVAGTRTRSGSFLNSPPFRTTPASIKPRRLHGASGSQTVHPCPLSPLCLPFPMKPLSPQTGGKKEHTATA